MPEIEGERAAGAPYVPRGTAQWEYARLVWEGHSYAAAARAVGVSEATAGVWRHRLRRAAERYRGGPVSYCYALRLLFEPGAAEGT